MSLLIVKSQQNKIGLGTRTACHQAHSTFRRRYQPGLQLQDDIFQPLEAKLEGAGGGTQGTGKLIHKGSTVSCFHTAFWEAILRLPH